MRHRGGRTHRACCAPHRLAQHRELIGCESCAAIHQVETSAVTQRRVPSPRKLAADPAPEHHALEQRVAGKPVGAVHAVARDLAHRVQARHRSPAVGIGGYTAHVEMRGWRHRDRRRSWIHAVRQTHRHHGREIVMPPGGQRGRVEPHGSLALHLPDAPGDHIPRGQIAQRMQARHQRPAMVIAQARACTAQRFGDQRQRRSAGRQRGRMELHELQVARARTGGDREGEPCPGAAHRIGGVREQGPQAAGGEHDRAGFDHLAAARRVVRLDASHAAVAQQQRIDIDVVAPVDVRCALHLRKQRRGHHRAGAIAAGVDNAGDTVTALAPQIQPVAVRVEHHPLRLQPRDRGRGGRHQLSHHRGVVVASARGDGVACVRRRGIGRIQCRGDTALRQHAGAAGAVPAATQQQHRLRCARQRGRQAGHAAADDQHRSLRCHYTRSCRPTASMRSSATRARTITPGAIVTSCLRSRRQA